VRTDAEGAAAERVETIARELISFNTTIGDPGHTPVDERACQEHVAAMLRDAGFEVDLWEPAVADVESHPMFMAGQNWAGRPIVVGRLPGSGGGRSLMFNGHIDTVPAGDLSVWTTDPWTPEVRDGRLYGRGACDMKGGVAAMLAAALALAERGGLPGDLVVEVVTDEEVNGMAIERMPPWFPSRQDSTSGLPSAGSSTACSRSRGARGTSRSLSRTGREAARSTQSTKGWRCSPVCASSTMTGARVPTSSTRCAQRARST
jgi:Peptidase family M20/M25/M40